MSYKSDLLDRLKDPSYCAGYLSAAMEDSSEAFLVALRDVAEARKGMANLANEAKVNRENLYRMLSKDGNPRLSSLAAIMGTLGLRLRVEPVEQEAPSKQTAPVPEQKQATTVHYLHLHNVLRPRRG